MASAKKSETVTLTLDLREARHLRSLLGTLAPSDFAADNNHPVLRYVRSKFPDAETLNNEIARALLALLGTGLGEA